MLAPDTFTPFGAERGTRDGEILRIGNALYNIS